MRKVTKSRPKIDKSVLTYGIPKRVRDRAYLDSFNGKPCMICGRTDTTVGAHVNYQNFARGLKASDTRVAPLCHEHHKEHDEWGDIADWWMKRLVLPLLEKRYGVWKNG